MIFLKYLFRHKRKVFPKSFLFKILLQKPRVWGLFGVTPPPGGGGVGSRASRFRGVADAVHRRVRSSLCFQPGGSSCIVLSPGVDGKGLAECAVTPGSEKGPRPPLGSWLCGMSVEWPCPGQGTSSTRCGLRSRVLDHAGGQKLPPPARDAHTHNLSPSFLGLGLALSSFPFFSPSKSKFP